jgi:hypothetical protein
VTPNVTTRSMARSAANNSQLNSIEADVLTAGTDATTVAIVAALVTTTEILEVILEVVAGRTITETTEAVEARGHTPEKRGHSEAPAPSPKQLANIGGPSPIQ